MQLGILGLSKSGKTTLFNTLTAARHETGKYSSTRETHVAVAKVPDARLVRLRELYEPRRYVPATVEYVDIPGIRKGSGTSSLDLDKLRTVDALVHVVRSFDDDELLHDDGSIDPLRDLASVDLELVLADHELVERRLERLTKSAKGGSSPQEERERELLADVVLPALEAERSLRDVELDPEDEKRLRGFQLLSAKPMLIVLNVSEGDIGSEEVTVDRPALVVSAPIEEEISRLGAEEQLEFLADIGLTEPSLDRVLRASYHLLGLISFFTVGEDEVRAWTIREGTRAREAAGAIHSDIARGFIRAEVVRWDDLLAAGAMSVAREKATLRLEGKEYAMQDGDVAHFRFNV